MKRPPKLISPARRWARRVVWAVFLTVLAMRIWFPPDPMTQVRRQWAGQVPGRVFVGQDGMQRRWRPSSRTRTPVAPLPTNLWRLEIRLSERDADKLRRTSFEWRRGPGDERPEVLVTVEEGGQIYTNVTMHLKGAAGSFRPYDDKPGMTLNFSKQAKGQKFHGFTKISLNNSVQDPSFVAEAISRELFVAAGVPTPSIDHATVVLNDRDLGLYVVAEGWGKPFLRKHFKEVSGNLYDSGFVQDVDGELDVNSGDEGPGRGPLDRLVAAATDRNRTNRWARLSEVLDVDRFATLLALEVMTCHWDGYGINRNNYRVFHDLSTGRFVFMPHGLDQLFGVGGRMPPTSSIEPGMRGIVARAFLSTPEGRRLYRERIRSLSTTLFDADRLVARAEELGRRIQPTLAAYGRDFANEEEAALRQLCSSIRRRAASIREQLDRPRQMVAVDDGGQFRPGVWQPRVGTQTGRGGQVRFERVERGGVRLLRIDGGRSGGTGSWRTQVQLEEGEYRFEGRAMVRGLGNQGGVCVRISGANKQYVRGQDGAWADLRFHFSVDQEADVELVCEFDSNGGEVSFDEASLRLVRQ